MKPQLRSNSSVLLLTFGASSLIIYFSSSLVQSQMIPITGIIDHTSSKATSEDPTTSTSSKSNVHAQIALEHLESQEEKPEEADVGKVTRKDKSKEFQNPGRHASEEGLLRFLLEQYKLSRHDDVEEQLDIIQNLEHFAHKYENGRDLFLTTDALKTIFLPALNSTSIEIRKAVCSLFAIAGQNNGIVQLKAMEAGVVRHMIHMLTIDIAVRPKALFAISSLLRNYPDAQKKFIQDGGVPEIIKIAFLPETRRRSLTFLMDLINERKFCDSEAHAKRRSKAYEERDDDDKSELFSDDPCDKLNLLTTALRNGGWCGLLSDSIPSLLSFDTVDQSLIIEAVDTSLDLCASKLTTLDPYFHQLLRNLGSDSDFEGTKNQLERILAAISSPTVSSRAQIEL